MLPTDDYAAEEWLSLRLKRGDFWRVNRPTKPKWRAGHTKMMEEWGTPDCRWQGVCSAEKFYEMQIKFYQDQLNEVREKIFRYGEFADRAAKAMFADALEYEGHVRRRRERGTYAVQTQDDEH
jgi:hypothetical protein